MEKELEPINQKIEFKNYLDTIIETERLILKPLAPEYADKIFPEFTDEITKFMFPSTPHDISETEKFINDSINKMKLGEEIVVSISDKATGEFLGSGGLHHIDKPTPELGIWIKKGAHGQKIGQEAVAGLKRWADENLTYQYLTYPVAVENIASRKIPESLGGRVVREFSGKKQNGEDMDQVEYHIYPND